MMSRLPLILLAGAVLAAAIAAGYFQSRPLSVPSATAPAPYRVCTPRVTRVGLASSTPPPPTSSGRLNTLARSLRRETQPRVFRSHPLAPYGWAAFDQWSGAYFTQAAESGRGPRELLVKRAHEATFRFANLRASRPYVRTEEDEANSTQSGGPNSGDGVEWPQLPLFRVPFRAQNLSVRAFFDELHASSTASASAAASSREYVYFADGLGVLGPHLSRDLMPIEPLCPFADVSRRCDMSLWIGGGGVTAYPHYDSSLNMFVQMRGRKKFSLVAPAGARCGLGLYPSLHPFYRQAQRDLIAEDAILAPVPVLAAATSTADASSGTCCALEIFDVELGPGDVLFVPPLWFHRVTSMPGGKEPSFSVNAWWVSQEFRTLAKVLKLPLPFQPEWNHRAKVFGAALYIRMMYEEMEAHLRARHRQQQQQHPAPGDAPTSEPAPSSGPFLAAELLVTRFMPLFEMLRADTPRIIDPHWCAAMQRNITTKAVSQQQSTEEEAMATCTNLPAGELRAMLTTEAEAAPSAAASTRDELMRALRHQFHPYVLAQMNLYRTVSAEMARLHVQNVVEEIAHWALGGRVQLLYPLVACCIGAQ